MNGVFWPAITASSETGTFACNVTEVAPYIQCSATHVIIINAQNLGLSGTLPSDLAAQLPAIHSMQLRVQSISGALPLLPTTLDSLDVAFNKLTAIVEPMPPQLRFFNGDHNDFSGNLPASLFTTHLFMLTLHVNSFTGSLDTGVASFGSLCQLYSSDPLEKNDFDCPPIKVNAKCLTVPGSDPCPTPEPTSAPTPAPIVTASPTAAPTMSPIVTAAPTAAPSFVPTQTPTRAPTLLSTPAPTTTAAAAATATTTAAATTTDAPTLSSSPDFFLDRTSMFFVVAGFVGMLLCLAVVGVAWCIARRGKNRRSSARRQRSARHLGGGSGRSRRFSSSHRASSMIHTGSGDSARSRRASAVATVTTQSTMIKNPLSAPGPPLSMPPGPPLSHYEMAMSPPAASFTDTAYASIADLTWRCACGNVNASGNTTCVACHGPSPSVGAYVNMNYY